MLLALCAAIYFLDGLIHSILGPLAPDIARALALGNAGLGPVFSANLAGQCVGLVLAPWLTQRFGHRAIIIWSVAGFGIGQCGSALADGIGALLGWRLLTGAFLGSCLPGCLAMVSWASPPKRRGLAIMMLFMGYGSGATAAGILAAVVGSWRGTMVLVGAASLLVALCALLWLRVPAAPTEEASDAEPSPTRTGLVGILSAPYRLRTLMLWLIFIALLTVSYCLNSWLPTLLVEIGHESRLAAMSVSIFSFGGIIAALVIGLLIDRFGAVPTLTVFICMSALLFATLGAVLTSASVSTLTALLGCTGFFSLGAYGGVNVVLAGAYPPSLRDTGIGWAKSVGRIGTVLAPIAIGFALDSGATGQAVLAMFAVPAAAALLALQSAFRAQGRPAASRQQTHAQVRRSRENRGAN